MTISRKIGVQIFGGTSLALGHPACVKLIDPSVAYYRQVRAEVGADCLIEMRWTEPNDYQPVDNPEQRADEWWERRKAAVMAVPTGDLTVIAGYNEKPKSEAAAHAPGR